VFDIEFVLHRDAAGIHWKKIKFLNSLQGNDPSFL